MQTKNEPLLVLLLLFFRTQNNDSHAGYACLINCWRGPELTVWFDSRARRINPCTRATHVPYSLLIQMTIMMMSAIPFSFSLSLPSHELGIQSRMSVSFLLYINWMIFLLMSVSSCLRLSHPDPRFKQTTKSELRCVLPAVASLLRRMSHVFSVTDRDTSENSATVIVNSWIVWHKRRHRKRLK